VATGGRRHLKAHDIQAALARLTGSASTSKPGAMAALTDFVMRHLSCGQLTAETTAPEANGYMLSVTCPCGVTFMRWVTPPEAARELVLSRLLNLESRRHATGVTDQLKARC
jgi:hypothetical protein